MLLKIKQSLINYSKCDNNSNILKEINSYFKDLHKDITDVIEKQIASVRSEIRQNIRELSEDIGRDAKQQREELISNMVAILREHDNTMLNMTATFDSRMLDIQKNNEVVNANLKKTIDDNVKMLADRVRVLLMDANSLSDKTLTKLENTIKEKLDSMDRTVNEKLQSTLENRLIASFKQVGDNLESVHKGLGEMRVLATNVGDLKQLMSNVKSRGTWGEYQVDRILSDILAPSQYEKNIITKKGSKDRVEFAIKLPKKTEEGHILLPIDSKFPKEDYVKLIEAQEKCDTEKVNEYSKALENRIKHEAKKISDKYIDVPYTTNFAIMYLPTEGLFAEVLRRVDLCENLLRDYRVVVCGATTLTAFLNSLQMGFSTLTIQKKSNEIWKILNKIRPEFEKFGILIEKVSDKLKEATNAVNTMATKSRSITQKLNRVEELPEQSCDLTSIETAKIE